MVVKFLGENEKYEVFKSVLLDLKDEFGNCFGDDYKEDKGNYIIDIMCSQDEDYCDYTMVDIYEPSTELFGHLSDNDWAKQLVSACPDCKYSAYISMSNPSGGPEEYSINYDGQVLQYVHTYLEEDPDMSCEYGSKELEYNGIMIKYTEIGDGDEEEYEEEYED